LLLAEHAPGLASVTAGSSEELLRGATAILQP